MKKKATIFSISAIVLILAIGIGFHIYNSNRVVCTPSYHPPGAISTIQGGCYRVVNSNVHVPVLSNK